MPDTNNTSTNTNIPQERPPINPSPDFRAVVIPEEYRPISMWGYFGYQLLFAIPCIGLIMLIIFSLGGTQNKNLRNFARSYFCLLIILVILGIILGAVLAATGIIGQLSSTY